jgi:3-deoxy-manno-octulosonate cytidylyltransferase (CMP-KDO synthetase)
LIEEQVLAVGGKVFRSQKEHESGSDRIAEALAQVDADLIVNVQGDEPFQDAKSLQDLVEVFTDSSVQMASLYFNISPSEAANPNAVKVVLDQNSDSLYFSRSPIPFDREGSGEFSYKKHVGIYAYRRELLLEFTTWPKGELEQVEMLEQLRILEHGVKIRMVETSHQAIAIDTAEDLERARNFLRKNPG